MTDCKVDPARQLTREEEDRIRSLAHHDDPDVRWAVERLYPLAIPAGSERVVTHPSGFSSRMLAHDLVRRALDGSALHAVVAWCDEDGNGMSAWFVRSLAQANLLGDLIKDDVRDRIRGEVPYDGEDDDGG